METREREESAEGGRTKGKARSSYLTRATTSPFTEHRHALTVSASLVPHLFTNNIFLLLDMAESSI